MSDPSDIVLSSFIGDALALGPHWIYDQGEIAAKFGRVTRYHAPATSYHPGKSAGDFTHYGGQTLVLLRSVAGLGKFDLEDFSSQWRAFWDEPENQTYRDGATRQTLANPTGGSDSHDIGGAARIGPLFLLKWADDEALVYAARRETAFTHPLDVVLESAEFFCRVMLAVRAGSAIPDALESVMAGREWKSLENRWLDAARKSAASAESDSAAMESHGLSCSTGAAFPAICHLLFRHPDDPAAALIENATAGGDSAARGMILGLVYGAGFPVSDLPAEWLTDLGARAEILSLLDSFA